CEPRLIVRAVLTRRAGFSSAAPTASSRRAHLLTRTPDKVRVEILVFGCHRPGDSQQLASRRTHSHFLGLSRGEQTLIAGFDHWIVLYCAQRGHIQRPTQTSVTAVTNMSSSSHTCPRLAQLWHQPSIVRCCFWCCRQCEVRGGTQQPGNC